MIGEAIHTSIKPDILGSSIFIIITLFPLLYHFFKGYGSNIHTISLSIVFIACVMMNLRRHNSDETLLWTIQTEYIQALTTILVFSVCVYKQFSLFQQLLVQHSWFHNKYQYPSIYSSKYLKWIMYSLSNIIISFYSFIYIKQADLAHINNCIHRTWILIIPIPYYLLPEMEYDLYFNRFQMVTFIISQMVNQTWIALYTYFFHDYISDVVFSAIVHCCMVSWIFAFVGLSIFMDKWRQSVFTAIINKCNNNEFAHKWFEYISSDITKFQRFSNYLLNINAYQNMLFVIELMQYKYALRNYVDSSSNIGMDSDRIMNIPGLNVSLTAQSVLNEQNDGLENIPFERIAADLCSFYAKYLLEYIDGDEILKETNILYATFVSDKTRIMIEHDLIKLNDFEILNVYNNALKDCNDILQLLYREYVIQIQ